MDKKNSCEAQPINPNLTLIRQIGVGLEVLGILYLPNGEKIPIIENKNYLFNDGTYNLIYQYSPKFKKNLWEFKDIPGRTEIKFHGGTHINHTKGCPIARTQDINHLHSTLHNYSTYKIEVKSQKQLNYD